MTKLSKPQIEQLQLHIEITMRQVYDSGRQSNKITGLEIPELNVIRDDRVRGYVGRIMSYLSGLDVV
jgi:hypothetical protein